MSWQRDRGRMAVSDAYVESLKKTHGALMQEIATIREKMHESWGKSVEHIRGLQQIADDIFKKEKKVRMELAKHGVVVNNPNVDTSKAKT